MKIKELTKEKESIDQIDVFYKTYTKIRIKLKTYISWVWKDETYMMIKLSLEDENKKKYL